MERGSLRETADRAYEGRVQGAGGHSDRLRHHLEVAAQVPAVLEHEGRGPSERGGRGALAAEVLAPGRR